MSALRLALVTVALLAIGLATPRAAPEGWVETVQSRPLGQLGASHVGEALDPGDGSQVVPSPRGIVRKALTTGGAPLPAALRGASGFVRAVLPVRSASMSANPRPTSAKLVFGLATWYEDPRHPRGLYAAAGPTLRRMLGPSWRGAVVIVEGPGRASVTVPLTDACWCIPRHNEPTLLDLSADAFERLAPLGWGVVSVSVAVGETRPALPQTDTEVRP